MNILYFISIFLVVEMILAFIFAAIAQIYYKKLGLDFRSIVKGLIERCFLIISLVNEFPHALTLFGALKVATRLKHTNEDSTNDNSYNDFYLIGNLVSVMTAIGYVFLYHYLMISFA